MEKYAETKDVPKWFFKDVALDLRNIQTEIDYKSNLSNLSSDGQSFLDNDNEILYYPIIDRIVSDYNEEIVKYLINQDIQSSYTVHLFGNGSNLVKTCNAYVAAYYHRSISAMTKIKEKSYIEICLDRFIEIMESGLIYAK